MICQGLLDEAQVTVDLSLLERAGLPAPLLLVGLALALLGVGLGLRAAPAGQRAWAALHLVFTPLATVLALASTRRPFALELPCLAAPVEPAARAVAIGAGLAALAFVQLALTLTLRAWKPERPVRWAVLCLAGALVSAGGVAWHKHALVREFAARLAAVTPVPNLRVKGTPPSIHLGQSLAYAPEVQIAGARQGLIFTSRVLMLPADARAWSADRVALTPSVAGPAELPVHLERDLVSVDLTLPVVGIEDRGPGFLPLAVGNRFEFVGTRGRGGAARSLEARLARRKVPLPAPTLVLEVTGEELHDGLHVFLLEVTRGQERSTERVVRRDGQLTRETGGVLAAVEPQGPGCRVELLTPSRCECSETRVLRCVDTSGDLGESLLRGFLAVVTLGITEIANGGMGDLGRGNETALLATRWRIEGVEGALDAR